MDIVDAFLSGAIAMAAFVIGLFFLRYWRASSDRFFLLFALAFWIEAVNRLYTVLGGETREDVPTYYLVRLLSYGLILWAILEKNLGRRK